ncbi:MAG: LOG family protein, partial [Lentisphaeria bacterium]
KAARAIRLHAEILHPTEVMKNNHIDYTVVVFGSARIRPQDEMDQIVSDIEKQLQDSPDNPDLIKKLRRANDLRKLSCFYDIAYRFSSLVSESTNRGETNIYIVTGGGPGIMEAGNKGPHDSGCPSVALNIQLPFEQYPNPYVTERLCFNFRYFSIRKMHFLSNARALCAFPGGYGTMDELFETLTLIQTEKVRRIPIVLFGVEFWNKLINWNQFVEDGLICEKDLELIHFTDSPDDAWEYIKNFWKEHGLQEDWKFV